MALACRKTCSCASSSESAAEEGLGCAGPPAEEAAALEEAAAPEEAGAPEEA